jgi:hypothetical protein
VSAFSEVGFKVRAPDARVAFAGVDDESPVSSDNVDPDDLLGEEFRLVQLDCLDAFAAGQERQFGCSKQEELSPRRRDGNAIGVDGDEQYAGTHDTLAVAPKPLQLPNSAGSARHANLKPLSPNPNGLKLARRTAAAESETLSIQPGEDASVPFPTSERRQT